MNEDSTSQSRAAGLGERQAELALIARLEAENRSLREENARAHQIPRSMVEYAIITLDDQGCITGWNHCAQQISGYCEAEVLGRSGDMIFTAEDRIHDRFTLEMCRALEDGRANNERWHVRRDGSRFWASGLMMPLLDADQQPAGFLNIFRDRTEVQMESERRELLMAEMNHRVKNSFATVQAVALQSGRFAKNLREFQAAFDNRLIALARSHDLLISGDWEDAPLRGILESVLSLYLNEPGRISIEGPAVLLPVNLVSMLTLAFHELMTNAEKHGALSVPEGSVRIAWQISPLSHGGVETRLVWRESGGPRVEIPERRGFGSHLLERGLGQFGSTLRLEFKPDGLVCRICFTLRPGSEDGSAAHPRRVH